MLKNIKTDERLQATSSMYSSRMIAESPYLGFSPQPGLRRCGKPSKGGLSTRGGWPQGSSPLWFFRPSTARHFLSPLATQRSTCWGKPLPAATWIYPQSTKCQPSC